MNKRPFVIFGIFAAVYAFLDADREMAANFSVNIVVIVEMVGRAHVVILCQRVPDS